MSGNNCMLKAELALPWLLADSHTAKRMPSGLFQPSPGNQHVCCCNVQAFQTMAASRSCPHWYGSPIMLSTPPAASWLSVACYFYCCLSCHVVVL